VATQNLLGGIMCVRFIDEADGLDVHDGITWRHANLDVVAI
jgi:hypothetical protein